MRTAHVFSALLLFCSLEIHAAQLNPSIEPNLESDVGTYLGVLFRPVPEGLRMNLRALPDQGGVIITHVLPQSPAEKAALKRHDVLLSYNDSPIRDCTHFARLIQEDQPGATATLTFVRDGKAAQAKVQLVVGPVLRIASRGTTRSEGTGDTVPGVAKQGGPGQVSVSALPMNGNRMKVTFEFYETGKLKQVICSGTPDEIDKQVQAYLPLSVRAMGNLAVEHLRKLRFQLKPASGPVED